MIQKVLLGVFMLLWSVLLLGYAFVFVGREEELRLHLHEELPAVRRIGVALGVYDNRYLYHDYIGSQQQIRSTIADFVARKQSSSHQDEYRMVLQDEIEQRRLYSPVYRFVAEVSPDAVAVDIIFKHQQRDIVSKLSVPSFSPLQRHREYEVSLGKGTMFAGTNTYLIQVRYADGTVLERRIDLQVRYERIVLGESVVYIDPHFLPQGQHQDILWSVDDFDGIRTDFVTWGCSPYESQPKVLIEHSYQYETIPACLSFSLTKRYLLWYEFDQLTENQLLFDIHRPEYGVIYEHFPLYHIEGGVNFFGLAFWDSEDQLLQLMRSGGSVGHMRLAIERHDLQQQEQLLSFQLVDGHQAIVETPDEQLLVYLYKERDNKSSIEHPGVRYQYAVRTWNDHWKPINQGTLYVGEKRVSAPKRQTGSTFQMHPQFGGNQLYLYDGLQVISFDIGDIGSTLQSYLPDIAFDQPMSCDKVELAVYDQSGERWQDESSGAVIVGRGRAFSNVKIYRGGETTSQPVERLYRGYLAHSLRGKSDLAPGENIYTIKGYDAWGNELCSRGVSIDISS